MPSLGDAFFAAFTAVREEVFFAEAFAVADDFEAVFLEAFSPAVFEEPAVDLPSLEALALPVPRGLLPPDAALPDEEACTCTGSMPKD